MFVKLAVILGLLTIKLLSSSLGPILFLTYINNINISKLTTEGNSILFANDPFICMFIGIIETYSNRSFLKKLIFLYVSTAKKEGHHIPSH